MNQNNHNNNTIFRSAGVSNLIHGQHAGNPNPSSDETLPPSILRPHLDALPFSLITAAPNGFPEFTASYQEIEYTVPGSVFAESCPVCDEIAMESTNPCFVARYPRGWVLVACKRHVEVLKTSTGGSHVCVGGQPELRSKAALRFHECEGKRREEKTVEQRARTATAATATSSCAGADEKPSAPPSLSPSNTTPTTPIPSTTPQDPCPICLTSKPTLLLSCSHTFCTPCLNNWQTTSTDPPLSSWLSFSSPLLLQKYPILAAILKSRFTCPMCRAYLQFTKQSRRKKKMSNKIGRGEEVVGGVLPARSRRGGQRNRTRRGRFGDGVLRSEWMPIDPCLVAPGSMPVVQRAQARQDNSEGLA